MPRKAHNIIIKFVEIVFAKIPLQLLGKNRPCVSYSTPGASVDSVHSEKFPQIALELRFGIRCTGLQIGLSSGNDSKLCRHAHSRNPVAQTLLDKHNM